MTHPAPSVEMFFDSATWTFSYVVADPVTRIAAIIDPVLDYDAVTRGTSPASAQRLLDYVSKNELVVHWILETHAHADHLSAAQWLKERLPAARVGIGEGIRQVQATFKNKLALEADFATDGRQFDVLIGENERLAMGALEIRAIGTPGHTPDSLTYLIGDAAFVGDTIFAPRYGTARCDFPGGDAGVLYDSMQRLLGLPSSTRIFLCHDYPPEGVTPQHLTDPESLRDQNIHLQAGVTREQFVAMREARDAKLKEPRLLEASLRANIRAGRLVDPYFR
jgi:glyoxylase-like metal-dependent hydrolase (beta-lactamase superfamily II)